MMSSVECPLSLQADVGGGGLEVYLWPLADGLPLGQNQKYQTQIDAIVDVRFRPAHSFESAAVASLEG